MLKHVAMNGTSLCTSLNNTPVMGREMGTSLWRSSGGTRTPNSSLPFDASRQLRVLALNQQSIQGSC